MPVNVMDVMPAPKAPEKTRSSDDKSGAPDELATEFAGLLAGVVQPAATPVHEHGKLGKGGKGAKGEGGETAVAELDGLPAGAAADTKTAAGKAGPAVGAVAAGIAGLPAAAETAPHEAAKGEQAKVDAAAPQPATPVEAAAAPLVEQAKVLSDAAQATVPTDAAALAAQAAVAGGAGAGNDSAPKHGHGKQQAANPAVDAAAAASPKRIPAKEGAAQPLQHAPAQQAPTTQTQATARTEQPAPAAPLARDQERFENLVKGLSARIQVAKAQGGGSLRMTLQPAALGEIVVRLNMTSQGAVATLVADTPEAGAMLAQNAGDLHRALADRGVQLERLEVQSGATSPDAGARGFEGQGAQREGNAHRSHYSFRAEQGSGELTAAEIAATTTTQDAASGVSYLA
jgi:flagellar hook-length control protein FliK